MYSNLTQTEAEEREQYLIYAFDSTNRKYGYNIALGGYGTNFKGRHHTEQSKKKLSLALTGNKNCLGRNMDEKTREKISKANKGRVHSEESKEKIRRARVGTKSSPETCKKIGEANSRRGQTQHAKDKISKANSGSNNGKAKKVICLNNNMVFGTITEATVWAGLKDPSGINGCCKGRYKTAGKHPETREKLSWKYYEEAV